jgi:hypothetical protein
MFEKTIEGIDEHLTNMRTIRKSTPDSSKIFMGNIERGLEFVKGICVIVNTLENSITFLKDRKKVSSKTKGKK